MRRTRLLQITFGLIALLALAGLAPRADPASAAPAGDYVKGCTGQYYDNMSLYGIPALTRYDPAINFFWGEGTSPAPGYIGVSNYSVRWTCGMSVPVSGTYTFTMVTDDGMNLLVDGNLLIWAWYDQGPTTYSNPIYLNAGAHTVVVEYYNDTLSGTAQVYSDLGGLSVYLPVVLFTNNYLNNCTGTYYNNKDLIDYPVLTRYDGTINFNWPAGTSPAFNVNTSYYSVRWMCVISIPTTRTYTLTAVTDDGMNVWVDNNLVISAWWDQSATTYSQSVYLGAGTHMVRVDYYNRILDGRAQVSLQ